MTDIEKEITRLQDQETMRLHMGELTPSELLVAQAAVRYALARARSERVVPVRELEALCAEWETQVRCAYYTEAKPLLEDLRDLIAKAGVGDE